MELKSKLPIDQATEIGNAKAAELRLAKSKKQKKQPHQN